MQISIGPAGGWAKVDGLGLPGPCYVRLHRDGVRAVVSEVYVDGRGAGIARAMKSLDLRALEAVVTSDPKLLEWVGRAEGHAGPDLSRLASHYDASMWGDNADHWVADAWRAQIPGSGTPQAPMGAGGTSVEPGAPSPVARPREGLTDDFLRSVAANYAWAVSQGVRPAPFIGDQTGYDVNTVRSWVKKARARGILAPAEKRGVAG
jgi:hypothetical protein